jgi:1-phosphatidylinositol phosphodiesterase
MTHLSSRTGIVHAGVKIAIFLLLVHVGYADVNPAYSHDGNQKTNNVSWMTYMQDSITLDQMSLPGSHDTMSYGYYAGIGLPLRYQSFPLVPVDLTPIPPEFVQTQSMNLMTQLNSGIRMIDIRCKAINNQFLIYHGDFFVGASFADVLNTVTTFLRNYPGEAVLMRVTNEVAGAPLNAVPDSVNSNLSFEQVFATYFNSSNWGPFFFQPLQGDQLFYNPTLGQIRGKIVVLQDFHATQTYGLQYSNFNIQDHYSVNSWEDVYTKWQYVKAQLAAAASGSPYQGYINFLSGAGIVPPYFVASGKVLPNTDALLTPTFIVTDSLTGTNQGAYPDFPRQNCATETIYYPLWYPPFYGTKSDTQCSIYIAGTDLLTDSFLKNQNATGKYQRTGILPGDFYGPSLLDRVITQNSVLTKEIGFPRGQLPGPEGTTSQCLMRPQGANLTLAANGWQNLVWQADGNLVIYDEKGPRWATGTNRSTTTDLCWQGDGNLVIYDAVRGPVFATGTNGRGQTLKFQTDCNLVIYDANGKPVWAPGGPNTPAPCHR